MATGKKQKIKSDPKAAGKLKKLAPKLTSSENKKRIPAPPGPRVSWEKQADYYDKYNAVEIEEAGYSEEVTDKKWIADITRSARAQRVKEAREQVNISLEPVQFRKLQRLAKKKHLSPSTLARCWLLERLTGEGA